MALSPADQSRLEDYQLMMGADAGQLALALDQLTDVMTQLAAHKVYCRVEKGRRAGEPPLDLVELTHTLQDAKSQVQQVLLRLRGEPSRPIGS
jgi:hypothetical protein